jgi:hypothetical protein
MPHSPRVGGVVAAEHANGARFCITQGPNHGARPDVRLAEGINVAIAVVAVRAVPGIGGVARIDRLEAGSVAARDLDACVVATLRVASEIARQRLESGGVSDLEGHAIGVDALLVTCVAFADRRIGRGIGALDAVDAQVLD